MTDTEVIARQARERLELLDTLDLLNTELRTSRDETLVLRILIDEYKSVATPFEGSHLSDDRFLEWLRELVTADEGFPERVSREICGDMPAIKLDGGFVATVRQAIKMAREDKQP